MVAVVQPITNTTVALAAANVSSIYNPASNQLLAIGVNSGASSSLAVPTQGVNGNPCGRASDAIPQAMVQLQNLVLTQAAYIYRI
jgi:hypothetical protein